MIKVARSSLLLFILLTAFLLSVPDQVSAAWSSEIRLTTSPNLDSFPSIAQVNNGNIWVAWETKASTSFSVYYRIYNGTTWLTPRALPKDFHQSSNRTTPFLMQTRNGTVWLFYSEKNVTGPYGSYYDIVYKQTNNYGLSWSETFYVTDSYYVPGDRYNNEAPSVVEALNGDIWVFWQRVVLPGPPPHREIFYKIMHEDSWSSEFQLTNFPSYVSINSPSVVQAKNGAIIVFWSADIDSNNYEIKYQTYDGVSWGSVEDLTSSTSLLDSDPAALLARTGAIWVIWELQDSTNPADGGNLFYTSSDDNGNTWAPTSQLTFSVDGSFNGQPSLAQGSERRIWVAWTSKRGDNFDIYYKISDQLLYHDVAISGISLSKTSPYQGADVQVTVNATNKGDFPETLTVECYVNQTLIGTQTTSLQGGNSALIVFPWVTSSFAPGRYYIKATVNQVPNENSINLGDNTRTNDPILLRIPGDVNADGEVDIQDLSRLNLALGARPGNSNWDQECDINENNIIDVEDLYILGSNYGRAV